jgi:hypothetical protein
VQPAKKPKKKRAKKTSESGPAILATNRLKAFSIRAAQRDDKLDSHFFAWIRG